MAKWEKEENQREDDAESMPGTEWDSSIYPYIPNKNLAIDPKLKLTSTCNRGRLIRSPTKSCATRCGTLTSSTATPSCGISGSPSCAYGHDFNPSLMDENGDFVVLRSRFFSISPRPGTGSNGPWSIALTIPGIEDGDIFLANDRWIGATHQSDVALVAPVFWEGELLCSVGNTLHQWDMGGTAPAGLIRWPLMCSGNPGCIPPIKIVRRGQAAGKELRRRIQATFAHAAVSRARPPRRDRRL